MRISAADLITALRIPCSFLLLCFPPFSRPFYLLYLLCGASDMIDGTVARKTGRAGEFGARLDSAADAVFAAAALVKVLPVLSLPGWVWLWMGIIALLKLSTLLWGWQFQRQWGNLHTLPNKLTGLLLFLFPLSIPLIDPIRACAVLCITATVAALHEGHCVRIGRSIL